MLSWFFSFLLQMFSMENQQLAVEEINPNGQNPNGESPKDNNSASLVQAFPVNADGYSIIDTDSDFDEKFPTGYRFKPYDRELVVHYLWKKIKNEPLPPNRIKEVKLYKFHPKELAENYKPLGENEWYFFTPRDRKYKMGKRPNRAAKGGYWKATGADKPVEYNDVKVGSKKALVFHSGKPPKGNKTDWIMHEFMANTPSRIRTHEGDMRLDDWVLCRMYKKKKVADRSRRSPIGDQDDSFHDDRQSETEFRDYAAIDMAAETFMHQVPGLVDMSGYSNQGRYFNKYNNVFMHPQRSFQNHIIRLPERIPQHSRYSRTQQTFPPVSSQNPNLADHSAPPAARPTFQTMDSNMNLEQLNEFQSVDYLELEVPSEDSYFDNPLHHN